MINGMTVNRWACINFSRSVQESVARGFCNELTQMCQVSGMVVVLQPLSLFSLSISLSGRCLLKTRRRLTFAPVRYADRSSIRTQ